MNASPAPRPFFRGGGDRASIALYAGDCLELLPRVVAPHAADVVVTSPPYNLGVPYGAYSDRRPREEYLAWMGDVARVVSGRLARHGSFFLNVGGPPREPWLPWDVARAVGAELTLQNVIHWVKSIVIDAGSSGRAHGLHGTLAVGHYKPVQSPRYLHGAHEYVFHFTRHGDVPLDRLAAGVPYQDKSNVARWKGAGGDRRCRGNTWFLPYRTIRWARRDRPHPATFPPELPERCFLLHGRSRIRLAVDPFVGIGSSAIAAEHLGVPFIGIDVDPVYLAVARRRLEASRPVDLVASATASAVPRRSRGRRVK